MNYLTGYCGGFGSNFLRGGFHLGSIFMWIIFALLIGTVIFLLVRTFYKSNDINTAVQILKEKYAKGEITRDEFEEKSKIIS